MREKWRFLGLTYILTLKCPLILDEHVIEHATKINLDIITDGSLEKNFRLYQASGHPPTQFNPAMTLDASKEFNVTLMLRNPERTAPIQQLHSVSHLNLSNNNYLTAYTPGPGPNAYGKTTHHHGYKKSANRDSGIFSNMRNNSLTGSTSTGSEETEKTLLHSSRHDLGIYL